MSQPDASSPDPDYEAARDLARQLAAAALRWVRQNPPGGRWRTWMFTVDATTDAIGPKVDGLHLSPGSPTEYELLEAVVRRTSGIRSTGHGLVLVFPASLREGGSVRSDLTGERTASRAPVVVPRHSGGDPVDRGTAVLAASVQLTDPEGWAVVVDRDDRTDHPVDPSGPDGTVVFPAPDLVPAFLQRAVLGEARVTASGLPPAGRLRVQGWVATVINASLEHGSSSAEVDAALDAAPSPEDVRTTTLQAIHDLVVAGELPGLPAATARWCGATLTAQVVAGVYGRLPEMLRYADEHWPRLGAELGRRTRTLIDAAG